MPKCKNCGSRLTKFDKDVCPVCGTKNPLDGVTSDTVEMTSFINMEQNRDFRVKKKSTMLFYSFVAGFTVFTIFFDPLLCVHKRLDPWCHFVVFAVLWIVWPLPWEEGAFEVRHHREVTAVG